MTPPKTIEQWLEDVRAYVSKRAPALLPIFAVCAGEAVFGRRFIAAELLRARPRAQVLEVGAGCMLLSCQLAREGYQVTALEPIGRGFTHLERIRDLVIERATELCCLPSVMDLPVEELSEQERFEFAFSINVMEHVKDVDRAIARIGGSLKVGARYRFTCPNYSFPYEPHFNIPTLISKRLTENLMWNLIAGNRQIEDPRGAWESLNWIGVKEIGNSVVRKQGLRVAFNREFLGSAFERSVSDIEFARRRPQWMRVMASIAVRLRLHRMICLLPVRFHPIIDCSITRVE